MSKHTENVAGDQVNVTGVVTFELSNEFGVTTYKHTVKNLVVTAGLQHIAACISSTIADNPTRMTHLAFGTSSTAPALANSSLGAEIGRVALAGGGGATSGNTITYTATFGAGVATGAIVEAGIFNAASAGVMLCRTTFPVINKSASDSLAVTWVVTIS